MAEADPFVTGNDGYSIVVVGNMNPAIHHPAWYKLIGALDDNELALSSVASGALESVALTDASGSTNIGAMQIRAGATIVTPQLAHFRAGKISIACTLQNLTISTYERGSLPRVLEIASLVFETLGHTPVVSYGFIFRFHRQSSIKNVGERLAELVNLSGLDFLGGGPGKHSAKMSYSLTDDSRSLSVSVEPSVRGSNTVFVGINANHPIIVRGELEQFDLTPRLREGIEQASTEADELLSKIIVAVEGKEQH
jgi:hypothetical protein